jgi:hypothetical protein
MLLINYLYLWGLRFGQHKGTPINAFATMKSGMKILIAVIIVVQSTTTKHNNAWYVNLSLAMNKYINLIVSTKFQFL